MGEGLARRSRFAIEFLIYFSQIRFFSFNFPAGER